MFSELTSLERILIYLCVALASLNGMTLIDLIKNKAKIKKMGTKEWKVAHGIEPSIDRNVRVSILKKRKRTWAVVLGTVTHKEFKHREEAYYYARKISDNVFVHNHDGSVKFCHRGKDVL